MGQWFKFVCDDCGYEAEVSGGPDAGMLVTVRTMSCSGCKNLVDVVISTHGYGDEDPRLQRSIGRCPKCRRKTGLEPWGKEKTPLGSFDSPVRWPEDFWRRCTARVGGLGFLPTLRR